MKYRKEFNENKTLNPEIIDRFSQIPEGLIFSQLHTPPLRHPGAIFNIAFSEVINSIQNTMDLSSALLNDFDDKKKRDDLEAQTELLIKNVCSIYDESYLILIALSKPVQSKRKFAYEWLLENGITAGSRFRGSVATDIQIFMDINNRLKHNNQKISLLRFEPKDNTDSILGFFVEGISEGNAISPDQSFHGQGKIPNYFSFNWLFSFTFAFIYFLADKLLIEIKKHLKSNHSFEFSKRDILTKGDPEIWNKLLKINKRFFPEERKLGFAKISRSSNIWKISFPHGDNELMDVHGNFKVIYHGDGYSKKFHLPGPKLK